MGDGLEVTLRAGWQITVFCICATKLNYFMGLSGVKRVNPGKQGVHYDSSETAHELVIFYRFL